MNYSVHATGRIEELLQEDQEVKARRERCHKQAAALTKLTKQLSLQEARTAVASGFQDSCEFNMLAERKKFLCVLIRMHLLPS